MSETKPAPATGAQTIVPGAAPTLTTRGGGRPSAAAAASRVAAVRPSDGRMVLVLSLDERRAEEMAAALTVIAPDREVLVMPPWDTLPYDRAEPSRDAMGRRMAVLQALAADPVQPRILVTSPEALLQKTPPGGFDLLTMSLSVGDALDRAALETFARRTGWTFDERVDEPGEIAVLGLVVDLFPPAQEAPVRLTLDDADRITTIQRYDPITQRTQSDETYVQIGAASELFLDEAAGDLDPIESFEARLLTRHGTLAALFAHLDDPVVCIEPGGLDRVKRVWSSIIEAHDTRLRFDDGAAPPRPEALYLTPDECLKHLSHGETLEAESLEPTPSFAVERSPGRAFKSYVRSRLEAGHRVVVAGAGHELRAMRRVLKRQGMPDAEYLSDWTAATTGEEGQLVQLEADLDRGFSDARDRLTVITATDLFGGRIAQRTQTTVVLGETELRLGDVVIHEDHGLGVLQDLERVQVDGAARDVVRLGYHGGASILAPVEDMDRIWRYGSEPDAVTLDHLNTDGWNKRRAEVSVQIDAAAQVLAERARQRAQTRTDPITPPAAAYREFASGFAFPESVDQSAAIDAVLHDLASGRPMNRLVCGDVGFGKTEVALRAAAATALAGRQVMVLAPTTVLARQHQEVFERRFAASGIRVASLISATGELSAEAVREGLAQGEIRVVVGTQALASDTVELADPGLVILDEEHRFGARMKADLAQTAPHMLSLSATPIPRTLQSAMVGIQDISLIASPPARRRPIRTFLIDFDPAVVRLTLMREKARGGQSFVIAPRIEDIGRLEARLAEVAPELKVLKAHGRMKPEALASVMSSFSAGAGDVLLATNIVENGLDVPRANTILIWRPDRFGLAQLHQLRGRVGRGRRQGFAYLLGDPGSPFGDAAMARLRSLEALDRLGAGFAISARDLDLRGGGDLIGDAQAGHIRLIGSALYQRVLGRALDRAQKHANGETPQNDAAPRMNIGEPGHIPAEYVPDVVVRINLYARLAQAQSAESVDALQEEIEDRFGPPPESLTSLVNARRLTVLAIAAGVIDVSSGPKATAFTLQAGRFEVLQRQMANVEGWRWTDDRLVVPANDEPHDTDFVESLLLTLAAA